MMASGGEAPLLLEGKPVVYFDSCPGCANDRRKAENPGIPYGQFFHIWIIILVSCLPISLLFPFIYFMIRDLHIAERVEGIGFYAGFVGASYMLGRALTSTAWGMIADRIGRKPVIILSIISTLLFNTLFGLSVNYWMAIATRFLLGSLNGLLGPIRAYAVEVCRTEHQAIGLTLVSTSWAIGLIIGPAIGGYLAQPVEKYPKLFPANSIFGRFPYFLPCLCVSFFCLVILISCIWLPETLHKHKLHKTEDQGIEDFAEQQNSSTTNKSLLKNWPLMSSIILFCVTSFDDMAYTENNSVPQEQRATANGLATTLMSFFKAFAPAGAGIVFSWAQKRQHAFLFPGDQMVFFLLDIVIFVELIWTFKPFLAIPEQIPRS